MHPFRSPIAALIIACAFSCTAAQAKAPLDCSAGPLTKAYGGAPWLVYACSDNETVVMMSAPGSPAMPFYFSLFKKDGKYVVSGEGTGSREVTSKAHAELVKLSTADVEALLLAAKTSGAKGK